MEIQKGQAGRGWANEGERGDMAAEDDRGYMSFLARCRARQVTGTWGTAQCCRGWQVAVQLQDGRAESPPHFELAGCSSA